VLCGSLLDLFADVGLFFKVDIAEWVVFKDRWGSKNIPGKYIKLVFTRGTKPEYPYLGLNLSSL
jgi:hypothetical protein